MAKVITIMNMKGGVGKTTIAMHLSAAYCHFIFRNHAAQRVLAIDYDPQFNLSQAFLSAPRYFQTEKERKNTLSILVDDPNNLDPFSIQVPGNENPPSVSDIAINIYERTNSKLDLVPSTLDLMYVALGQPNKKMTTIENRFKKFIDDAKTKYDLILLDCHPAGSIFTQTSLKNSDHVIIPVVPQRYAVRGVGLMMEFIKAKTVNGHSITPHILFNQVSRVGISPEEATIRNDKEFGQYCLNSTLKKYKAFTDPEAGNGFAWQSGKPYSGEAKYNLISVAHELLNKIYPEAAK